MIDRSLLLLLREVRRRGGVTAAAARLHVSQSALSHMVAKFEARAGVRLWLKEGRSVRFTQAGEHLLALADRLLPQFEQAERALADFAQGRRGTLRFGMECHPCQSWLMRRIGPYLEAWPDVEVEITQGFRFDGAQALADHEIDVLITPDPSQAADLSYTPVLDYELVLAVPRGHALAGREAVAPEDLASERLLSVPVAVDRLDVFTRFLLPAGVRPRAHQLVETTDMILRLVAAGRGVAALPDWLAQEGAAGLPVAMVRLGPAGLRKSLHVGLRRGEATIAHVAAFLRLAQAAPA